MNYSFSVSEPAAGVRMCKIKASQFKTACISVNLALPLGEDASANVLLLYLLHRCTRKYPDMRAMNMRLGSLYGADIRASVGKIGEAQVLQLYASFIDDRFALDSESVAKSCADMLADMLFEPKLDENGRFFPEDIEREKRMLSELYQSELNDKKVYALRRCTEIMFASEAYSVGKYGTLADIQALTPEKVYSAWRRVLETARVQIDVIGNVDFDSVEKLFSQRFSCINRAPVEIKTQFIKTAGEPKRVREPMDIKQGKLVIGMRAGTASAQESYPALRVMCDLYGGSPHSKLFSVVREKMSLCYYCSARLTRQKGIIMIQSGVECENEEKAERAILEQLELVRRGEFSDDDLKASVDALSDAFRGASDSPDAIDAWFSTQILDSQLRSGDDFADEIESVTREQVVEAANGVTLDTVYMLYSGEGEAEK